MVFFLDNSVIRCTSSNQLPERNHVRRREIQRIVIGGSWQDIPH